MPSYRDLLRDAKSRITEISPEEAEARLGAATFLDVREQDEHDQGTIPGSVFIPRGHLESQAETRLIDRDQPIVVYCAGGNRSAFATETLEQLGFTDVVSMAGGFGRWKNEGRPWITPQTLTAEQRDRYGRHILLPEVGEAGQQKLLESRVLLLGAGGLGSPAALYLAAAGVGTIGIIDMDVVDASNLQRQILHNTDRIGERKVDSAKKTLTALNPDVDVVTYDVRLGADNVLDIIDGYDVIVDGTDNFPTRYLVNDASLLKRIPVVHGSIFRFEGQVSVFQPYVGPCYRCLLPEPPPPELAPSCSEAGVIGVLPGIVGSIQALEAIKLLLDLGDPLIGRLLAYDALGAVVPRVQGAARPQLPGVRRARGAHRHRRVRRAVPPPRRPRRRQRPHPLTPLRPDRNAVTSSCGVRRRRDLRSVTSVATDGGFDDRHRVTAGEPGDDAEQRVVARTLDAHAAAARRRWARTRASPQWSAARSVVDVGVDLEHRVRGLRHRSDRLRDERGRVATREARAARTATGEPRARAGRGGTCASRRAGRPTRRGTNADRSTRAGTARPTGSSRRRRDGGSRSAPAHGHDTRARAPRARRRRRRDRRSTTATTRRWCAPRAHVDASRSGSTCSSFASARSAVSSMPSIDALAAERSPTAMATASSSSSSSGGRWAPAARR